VQETRKKNKKINKRLRSSSPDLPQIFPKSLQEILEKPVVSALGMDDACWESEKRQE
jgi:hypothetical protein